MKTISEYRSECATRTSTVYWYAKPKMWLVRYYVDSKKIAEKLFDSEESAEISAEDYVIDTVPGVDTDYVVVDPE